MMLTPNRPKLLLIILDGWGDAPAAADNAISQANTPIWNHLLAQYPNTRLHTSGAAVGLPAGQMGNSEVGHMNIGAGRVVYQSLTRIQNAVDVHQFQETAALVKACQIKSSNALHIVGLLSDGGVHSHQEHIWAMIDLAKQQGVARIYLHAILDGRDTAPKSAEIALMATMAREDEQFKIASVIGRYFAMDRDNNWDRVQQAYQLFAQGLGKYQAQTATEALVSAYARGETDEFVQATSLQSVAIQAGDSVVMMNFRADRARELAQVFVDPQFEAFVREPIIPESIANKPIALAHFTTLTAYQADLAAAVAFAPESLQNSLGAVIAEQKLKQFRIAETEKYAHVTYFFNGGDETPLAGEERCLVPSPAVATYDLQPEMSAPEVTDKLIAALRDPEFTFYCVNYANPDMVGHSGVFVAAVQAVETIDRCLGRIVQAAEETQTLLLITADHGNIEDMLDEQTGEPITAHTTNPVPLVFYAPGHSTQLSKGFLREGLKTAEGALCDIAPTILSLLDLPIPAEMTGKVLLGES